MTLVVKLGSSIVAADDGELRADVLDSVCEQVAAIRGRGEDVVLVTSGAIARGIGLLDLSGRPTNMDALQAASAVGQGDLFRAYEERLRQRGVRAAQLLLTLADFSERAHYLNARQTLQMLRWNVVPIINENDTTSTDEITFGDNDFLAALVAGLLKARLLVLLTNTDGVFTADPRNAPDAELIGDIGDTQELAAIQIGATSQFGRGGMGSKITAARIASESGVPVVICNGTAPGTLETAVSKDGLVGTRVRATPGDSTPPYKLWLKYAKQPAGSLVVDEGAARVLRERGSSLLAVGIVDSDGAFNPGDAVWVVDDGGREPIGKGITEFGSFDVAQIMGRKSDYLREHFPDSPDEVIHRDRFVLL
jgi:glutamate 5-kinase